MKKILIIDVLAAILIVLKLVLLALGIEQVGAMGYILLDVIVIAIILFVISLAVGTVKPGNKTILVNAVVLIVLQLVISGVFGCTTIAKDAEKKLDNMILIEAEQQIEGMTKAEEESGQGNQSMIEENKNMDEGLEVTFTDGNSASGILTYGFYFVIALAGGKLGSKKKTKIRIK